MKASSLRGVRRRENPLSEGGDRYRTGEGSLIDRITNKNIILESKELYKTQCDSQNGQREKLNSFEKVAPSE